MRVAVVCLALAASSCAFEVGIDPSAEPSTTATTTTLDAVSTPTTTTAPVDPVAEQAAILAARAFLDRLSAGEWAGAVAMVDAPPSDLAATLGDWADRLDLTSIVYTITTDQVADDTADIGVSATLTPFGFQPWRFDTSLHLVTGDEWRVVWSPSILHPDLEEGDTLVVERVWGQRAAILAGDGTPLATTAPTWTIGVVPERIEELDTLIEVLDATAGISSDTVRSELSKPGVQPDWFVPVGTIAASETNAVDTLLATPGVLLREGTGRVYPSADLTAQVVGKVGPITAERLLTLGGPYGPADQVGVSGIEAAFERRLAGTPDQQIVRVNRYGRELETLVEGIGEAPQDVTTTIDVTVQLAAERALADVTKPVAIVIVDTATSEVLASVSRPIDGFDRAFLGTYPPGSTFKIVTAAALLENGMSPDDDVACPGEVTLGGMHIRNAGDRDLGTITLTTAFAESCNTTFTALAVQHLSATIMSTVARAFGFEVGPDVGLPAATPRYPDPADTAELAASAMGQGRVLVTPLQQASIAAAVAAGGWMPPTVIAGTTNRVRIPLDPEVASQLADMMLAVVTEGGGGKAKVPGEVVRGKTGSAEFNDQGDTHAWFVGYWDHLAIAVVVEDGGSGGQTAAPIAAAIIREVMSSE